MKLTLIIAAIPLLCLAPAHLSNVPENLTRCCTNVSEACLEVCNQISLADIKTEEGQYSIVLLKRECKTRKSKFWRCVNSTLLEMTKRWQNRPCCSLPNSSKCRLSCLQAESRADISQGCRVTDEISFFQCLDRHDAGEECCRNARTRDCYRQCRDAIRSQMRRATSQQKTEMPSAFVEPLVPLAISTSRVDKGSGNHLKYNNYPGQRIRYLQACKMRSPRVLKCLEGYSLKFSNKTHSDIHCCRKSESRQCQEACKKTLSTHTDDQKIMEGLSSGPCGPPFPGNQLWQCFLENSEPHIESSKKSNLQKQSLVLDNAKLLCCNKATSITCEDLCIKTFSTDWNQNWETFQRLCQYNHQEIKMLRCLADVDEPCRHGCTNLTYCSNFNNDGKDLFRSCNAQSDMAAQKDVYFWQKQRLIRMPNIDIPILDVSTCLPQSWKAVACILQIKPCQRSVHSNFICRSDCLRLLHSCVDNSRLPFGHSPESLCHLISPPDGAPCMPLNLYTSTAEEKNSKITTNHGRLYPCNHHNCSKSEVCIVNNDKASTSLYSSSFKCVPGCALGEMSSLKVTTGTIVRVPLLPYKQGCHQSCECTKKKKMGKCKNIPCVKQSSCWHRGKLRSHQTQFLDDCNVCSCYSGRIICTKLKCPVHAQRQVLKIKKPGTSCNCPAHYSPVCGRNGKTFPNGCIARHCFGMSQHSFVYGECYSINPCYPKNPCRGHSQKCIPRRRVCLADELCPQYECVAQKKNGKCGIRKRLSGSPVCDINGKDHADICDMLLSKQSLEYWDKCQSSCDHFSGLVCGADGETYSNECSAKANAALVDYHGPCKDIGPLTSFSTHRCSNVKCQLHEVHTKCKLVIPPGACCPVCASVFRMLLNKQKLEAIRSSLQAGRGPITVQSIIERLYLQVKVIGCKLYGHLDIYGDLIVIVKADGGVSSNHYKRCHTEADRLLLHLGPKSPVFMSDGLLSTIEVSVQADMVTTSGSAEASGRPHGPVVLACFILVIMLF